MGSRPHSLGRGFPTWVNLTVLPQAGLICAVGSVMCMSWDTGASWTAL
jgi:hypothetical protein